MERLAIFAVVGVIVLLIFIPWGTRVARQRAQEALDRTASTELQRRAALEALRSAGMLLGHPLEVLLLPARRIVWMEVNTSAGACRRPYAVEARTSGEGADTLTAVVARVQALTLSGIPAPVHVIGGCEGAARCDKHSFSEDACRAALERL